jgi:hypothetical protein
MIVRFVGLLARRLIPRQLLAFSRIPVPTPFCRQPGNEPTTSYPGGSLSVSPHHTFLLSIGSYGPLYSGLHGSFFPRPTPFRKHPLRVPMTAFPERMDE